MSDWSSEGSDPIGDLMAWRQSVSEGAGLRPTTIFMNSRTSEMYEWCLRRDEILRVLLEMTTWRSPVRRYVLRRLMGQSRLAILAPRIERAKFRAHMRWKDWKHRNDPYWGY